MPLHGAKASTSSAALRAGEKEEWKVAMVVGCLGGQKGAGKSPVNGACQQTTVSHCCITIGHTTVIAPLPLAFASFHVPVPYASSFRIHV
jgi:hypothetical protein